MTNFASFYLSSRYYCFNKTHEKDVEAVFEEITDDDATLPCFGNKIICKVREAQLMKQKTFSEYQKLIA